MATKKEIEKRNPRRVFNPLTGETLDVPVLKSSLETTDRIDLLIEDGLYSRDEGFLTRITKLSKP